MTVLSTRDWDFWEENGYVVVPNSVPQENLDAVVEAMQVFCGRDFSKPEGWYGIPRNPGSSLRRKETFLQGLGPPRLLGLAPGQAKEPHHEHPAPHQHAPIRTCLRAERESVARWNDQREGTRSSARWLVMVIPLEPLWLLLLTALLFLGAMRMGYRVAGWRNRRRGRARCCSLGRAANRRRPRT